MKSALGALVLVCFLPLPVLAADPCPDDMAKAKIDMTLSTKLVTVTNLSVPAAKYVSDNDPDTLEIVFLSKPEDGSSRVSDDGEVVFLTKDTSADTQQTLINQAYEIRFKKRYGDRCPEPY